MSTPFFAKIEIFPLDAPALPCQPSDTHFWMASSVSGAWVALSDTSRPGFNAASGQSDAISATLRAMPLPPLVQRGWMVQSAKGVACKKALTAMGTVPHQLG